MKLPDDFRDALICLHDAKVDFVLIGGYAVAHHGHIRATKDIHVFIRPSPENAAKVMAAMAEFGAPLSALGVRQADFATKGKVVQFGVPPLRIDLLTDISGVDFDSASKETGTFHVDGRAIPVIGLDALIRNKKASGRPQDVADISVFERLQHR